MVPVRQNLCDPSMYYCKCPFVTDKDGICVHNTANSAPARNEVSYMINNTNQVSFHAAVDDKEVIIGIPYNRNAWASGDGHGDGNMHKIHIEICYSTGDSALFDKSERNGAEYIAHLLKEYGWGMNRIFKHQDFDGKYCPHKTLDKGWGRFLDMVKSYYNTKEEPEEDDEMLSYDQFKAYMDRYNNEVGAKPVPQWGADAWKDICADKILDGSRPESPVRRVELALVLERMKTENLPVSDWAKNAWEECVKAGLLDGTKPVSPLTRQEFAVVLDRLNKMATDDPEEKEDEEK